MSIWSTLKSLLSGNEPPVSAAERVDPEAGSLPAEAAESAASPAPGLPGDPLWQQVYTTRRAWFEHEIGDFPGDLLKVRSLSGVWPGGGLFALPADRIAPGAWLYTTFGLTNRDMPAPPAPPQDPALPAFAPASGAAGYGHELVLLTHAPEQWPLWVLQWAATAELLDGTGLLGRVEQHGALTVQDIEIDEGRHVNLLIALARPPLPTGADLPNGRFALLAATVISDAEMRWSLEHGRLALLDRLFEAGVGQFSDLRRADVV